MSTSIALVTCAAVSSERRMCSAIPRRIALIGSSVSPASSGTARRRAPVRAVARRRPAERLAARPLAAARGAAAAPLQARLRRGRAPDSTKARMSFLVTRPSRPVPVTADGIDPVLGGDPRDDRRDEACGARRRSRCRQGPALPARLPAAGSGSVATGSGTRLGLGSGSGSTGSASTGSGSTEDGSGAGTAAGGAAATPSAARSGRRASRPRPSRPPGRGSPAARPCRGSAPRCRPCRSRSRAAARRPGPCRRRA